MTTLASPADVLTIDTFSAPGDGCLGYLVVDETSRTALAIDPRLDQVDRFVEALAAHDARLTFVLDTHTHADHLSGVRRLARRTGATVLAHAASKLQGPVRRIKGGATFELGTKTVTIVDAPGHTPDSLAVLVEGHLFTGDALFAGGAGRTDFMGGSAADLFDTLRGFESLPDATVVHPGHDYVGRAVTTIGEEKASNPLLREPDRAAFVARLSAKSAPPANMAAILRHNLGEADAATITAEELQALRQPGLRAAPPRRAKPDRVRERAHRGRAQRAPGRARCPPGRDPRGSGSRRRVPHGGAGHHRGRVARAEPGAGRGFSTAGCRPGAGLGCRSARGASACPSIARSS